jgi:hypothetical protein
VLHPSPLSGFAFLGREDSNFLMRLLYCQQVLWRISSISASLWDDILPLLE